MVAADATNAWWQVDLGADNVVSEIKLHNELDSTAAGANCGWRIITKLGCQEPENDDPGPGFTLGVSRTPCNGTSLCGGTVCKTITRKSEMNGLNVPTVTCPANTVGRQGLTLVSFSA